LFLDELGELSPNNQSKLLRIIEDGIIEPLGSNTTRKINVRLITATNRNLTERVEQGLFREDLYYRLRIGEIWLPPLRERASDIPKIALHYLKRINPSLKEPKQLTQASLEMLRKQAWPGNVRDLRNAIERAAMLSPSKQLSPSELHSLSLFSEQMDTSIPKFEDGFSLENYLSTLRQRIIQKALDQSDGNQSKAARLLGITPQAVHKYLKSQNETSITHN
ncbi:MAG TPA: hypothetical protein DIU37_02645, partial [Opitutae bacterium]|nr:hypothetical protein [Opitutae bacterium]